MFSFDDYIDDDHEVAQRIARKANQIYGTDYRVDWAYIDFNRRMVYNGSEYVGTITNTEVRFNRNGLVTVIDLADFLDDGGY